MTGPEHLREGKRLLAGLSTISGNAVEMRAVAAVAQAHLTAAQVIAYAAKELPLSISWQEAGDA